MKNIVLASIATLIILSGCSQKNPEVDMSSVTESTEIVGGDISGLDSASSSSESADRLASIASKLSQETNTVYFDFDKFNIRPDMMPVIDRNAALFNSPEAKDFSIKVEGNCDDWGTDEYNYALGLKRAKTAKDALVAKGINPDRIMIVSYGESNPVCTEKTKACWAKNRRDDFKVLP